jgi:hypothetical protein
MADKTYRRADLELSEQKADKRMRRRAVIRLFSAPNVGVMTGGWACAGGRL